MFIKSICLSNFKGFIGDNHQITFKNLYSQTTI